MQHDPRVLLQDVLKASQLILDFTREADFGDYKRAFGR
jgi:hypothetical protein